jgi:hypothetical protein
MDEIVQAVREFFQVAAASPFQIKIQPVPLRDVEALWNKPGHDARLVFQP